MYTASMSVPLLGKENYVVIHAIKYGFTVEKYHGPKLTINFLLSSRGRKVDHTVHGATPTSKDMYCVRV